jgi:hypothetical protein
VRLTLRSQRIWYSSRRQLISLLHSCRSSQTGLGRERLFSSRGKRPFKTAALIAMSADRDWQHWPTAVVRLHKRQGPLAAACRRPPMLGELCD